MPISTLKASSGGKGKQKVGTVASINRTRIEDITQYDDDDDDDLGQPIEHYSRPGPSSVEIPAIKPAAGRKKAPQEVISIDSDEEDDCNDHEEDSAPVVVNNLHEELLRKRKEVRISIP